MVKLGMAVTDLIAHRSGPFRQQVYTVAFHAKPGAEVEATLGHRFAGVVQDRRSGMFHLRRTPTWPRQTVGLTIDRTTLRQHGIGVEGMPVLLVRLQPLGALAGVTDGPHTAVELAGGILDQRLIIVHLDVLGELLAKTQLLGELIHDGLIGQRLEQRLDNLRAPLQVAVRRRHRAVGLELRGRRQHVHAVGAVVHDGTGGRHQVDNHQQIQFLHGLFHFQAAGLAVGGMTPVHHRPQIVLLGEIGLVLEHAVYPTRHRDALGIHRLDRFALALLVTALIEARLHPVVVDIPDTRPVLPGTG